MKTLKFGDKTYFPGETIPEGVILPERVRKLINSNFIAEGDVSGEMLKDSDRKTLYTESEVVEKVKLAVNEAIANQSADEILQDGTVEQYTENIIIPVESEKRADGTSEVVQLAVSPNEVQQIFEILQMNADDASKAIAEVESENVLILLHASDSRKTIENAVKKRIDTLNTTDEVTEPPSDSNEVTDTLQQDGNTES
jgi:hypothetical protein